MTLARDEGMFLSSLAAAQLDEPLPRVTWVLYLVLAAIVVAVVWSTVAKVDMVTRTDGRVVPDGREQIISTMEIGILSELLVHEGEEVEQGEELVRLDPTRVEAQQSEAQVKRFSLKAAAARLSAEASGRPLAFPAELKSHKALVDAESESYELRRKLLEEAVSSINRSASLLSNEMKVAQDLSSKGLMSNVEVMRLSRQVNELQQQRNERISRFKQEASGELVKVQNELAMLDEQMVVREDSLARTVLKSPVNGLVKNIRSNTVGGVITAGAPIMEIVPMGGRVLVEARIKPMDVGFIHVGQKATVKLSSYDFNVFGGLIGRVEYISPDALGDAETPNGDARYYRARISAEKNTLLKSRGEQLPVIPGMTATVEIKTGERSVMSFLLRPMMKSTEAMRER
ncbi:HlyD family type I secretion periplasmic adaptor subunit [Paucibacter sp. Y2R2-4]|uniref:HlyD family type I secretion periplasmic adaptor subunit n=1 Tax=Paucibacter sp. Y2R2-4 TaxID=2893553 RepID=UPI0021E4CEAB|nr:HlyD family type I secretion periplasmic adaptor subunit [Paucibacter sp. Y2R2-4]MCV2348153.1 HlyD family type I secretion periplasmic adaptor subunit [Paucibacter sp. Y2R2-4]